MSENVTDTQPIKKPTIPKDATVLVVEDNVANFVLIARMLGYLGIHCEWKTSGYEVVEYADTLQRLDLILMDIAMPQEDGLAATRRIREEIGLADTPIVALTAFDTDGFRQAAFDAGFNGYLTKPIDFDRLRKLLEMLLSGASGNFGGTTSQSGKNTTSLA